MKAKEFLAPLNNTQKVEIITGKSFSTSDGSSWTGWTDSPGVNGVNFYFYESAFVLGNALAQTWDRDLVSAHFKAAGDEFFGTGFTIPIGLTLSPMGRVP